MLVEIMKITAQPRLCHFNFKVLVLTNVIPYDFTLKPTEFLIILPNLSHMLVNLGQSRWILDARSMGQKCIAGGICSVYVLPGRTNASNSKELMIQRRLTSEIFAKTTRYAIKSTRPKGRSSTRRNVQLKK